MGTPDPEVRVVRKVKDNQGEKFQRLQKDKEPTRLDKQLKEDYIFFQLSRMIELKKKGKTINQPRTNKGLQSGEAVQDAKARLITVIGKDQWYTLKCRRRKVMLATDWNIPTCYEELTVWVEPDEERSNI